MSNIVATKWSKRKDIAHARARANGAMLPVAAD
jgi:hypothetical protein